MLKGALVRGEKGERRPLLVILHFVKCSNFVFPCSKLLPAANPIFWNM